ncbi:MAG: glycosyltransferase family 2 protein, partial [Thiobacillaceae bacterium]
MNWLPAPGSDAGITSVSAAQRAISYDGGAVPADAGLSNTSGGMVSRTNFANSDLDTRQSPASGKNVVGGDIYSSRPSAPAFKDDNQGIFVGQFNGYPFPYGGEWNQGVPGDDDYIFSLNGANVQGLTLLGDGEAPSDLVSHTSSVASVPKLSQAVLMLAGLGLLLFVAPWRVHIGRDVPESANTDVDGVRPLPDKLSWLFPDPPPAQVERRFYLPVAVKLAVAHLLASIWLAFSIYVALPWLHDLSTVVPAWFAILVTAGIAFLPGYVFAFVFVSLLLDRRPPSSLSNEPPPLSILVAAYNEEDTIAETLNSIIRQEYPAPVEIILVDDGSRDRTVEIAQGLNIKGLQIRSMGKNGGKARALNAGLALATHALIVTIDADTNLYKDALQRLVARYLADPPGTVAVAGAIHVRNSRDNWLTKIQEWDYFHGIAVIKRVQSLYQGVLVAQGAFSLYTRQVLQEAGGWPECVGEDIVLTWDLMEKGHRVGYAEDAVVFTRVPATYRQYY